MTTFPQLGGWRRLVGSSGARLAVSGDQVAAAGIDRLSVWRGDARGAGEPVLTITAGTSVPSRPRFVGDRGQRGRLCWGTTVVDLSEVTARSLDDLARVVIPEPVPRVPGHAAGSPQLTDLAWSDDGSAVLVSCQTSGASQSLSASATLYRSTGERVAELWRGPELSPVAGLVGPGWALVGCPQPVVSSFDGARIAVLHGATPPRRIDADTAATRVLTVEAPMLRLWDAATWTLIASVEGLWADACLGPDAGWVLAVDYEGQLHVLDDRLQQVARWEVPGPLDGIAVGDRLVAAAAGGAVYSAPLGLEHRDHSAGQHSAPT